MKGFLIVLLFSGQTYLQPFDYEVKELGGTPNENAILSCSERADELRETLAEHYWEKDGNPRAQGWYLKDGRGTLQGHIC